MRIKYINWKKGGVEIGFGRYFCECSGNMRFVTSAGCAHDDDYQYLFQCEKCMKVEATDYRLDHKETDEELEEAGWELIK